MPPDQRLSYGRAFKVEVGKFIIQLITASNTTFLSAFIRDLCFKTNYNYLRMLGTVQQYTLSITIVNEKEYNGHS